MEALPENRVREIDKEILRIAPELASMIRERGVLTGNTRDHIFSNAAWRLELMLKWIRKSQTPEHQSHQREAV